MIFFSKIKKTIILFSFIFLFAPFFAGAVGLAELNTQIADMLAKVFTLQAQLKRAQMINAFATSTATSTPSIEQEPFNLACLKLKRNLSRGDSGSDVVDLQLFLARNTYIYPEALITGKYGLATERAVKRYQVYNGIIAYGSPSSTGWGVVGPKTRAKMASNCSEPENKTATTTATTSEVLIKPLSLSRVLGDAPLNTFAKFTLSDVCVSYFIDWGDGTAPAKRDATSVVCTGEQDDITLNHVYTKPGIYTILLKADKKDSIRTLRFDLPIVSYKALKVGGAIEPFHLSKTSGPAPLSVTASFLIDHPACTSYYLDWGDTQVDQFEAQTFACSKNPVVRRITHVYDEVGDYDVTLRLGQDKLDKIPIREEWLVSVSELQKGKTVIELTNTTGPAPLRITVDLATADGHCTSYEVNWGDSPYNIQRKEYIAPEASEFNADDFVTASDNSTPVDEDCTGPYKRTFTHTYTTYGTFPLSIKLGKGLLKDIQPVVHQVRVFPR